MKISSCIGIMAHLPTLAQIGSKQQSPSPAVHLRGSFVSILASITGSPKQAPKKTQGHTTCHAKIYIGTRNIGLVRGAIQIDRLHELKAGGHQRDRTMTMG